MHIPNRLFFKLVDRALDLTGTQGLAANLASYRPSHFGMPAIGTKYAGGTYAGLSVEDEQPVALILLDGDEKKKWDEARQWAQEKGGVLPSRFDQLVLFKNLKVEFKEDWYWSAEQCAGASGYAWCQFFGDGGQDGTRKGTTHRARAVRRLPIQ